MGNTPTTFQRLMELALGERRGKNFVFLDDIIIYSQKPQWYSQDIQCLIKSDRPSLQKNHFFCTSLRFLDHMESAAGVEVDPLKTKAVEVYPVPKNFEISPKIVRHGWMVPSLCA